MIAASGHGKEPMLARMGQKWLSIGAVEQLTGLAFVELGTQIEAGRLKNL